MKNLERIQVYYPIRILYEDTFAYLVMINGFIQFTACLEHTEHCFDILLNHLTGLLEVTNDIIL